MICCSHLNGAEHQHECSDGRHMSPHYIAGILPLLLVVWILQYLRAPATSCTGSRDGPLVEACASPRTGGSSSDDTRPTSQIIIHLYGADARPAASRPDASRRLAVGRNVRRGRGGPNRRDARRFRRRAGGSAGNHSRAGPPTRGGRLAERRPLDAAAGRLRPCPGAVAPGVRCLIPGSRHANPPPEAAESSGGRSAQRRGSRRSQTPEVRSEVQSPSEPAPDGRGRTNRPVEARANCACRESREPRD